jgi:hypothetical protein
LPFFTEKNYTSNSSAEFNGNSVTLESSLELDTGVIFFGFSFSVICLLILVQVPPLSFSSKILL